MFTVRLLLSKVQRLMNIDYCNPLLTVFSDCGKNKFDKMSYVEDCVGVGVVS